MDVTIGPSRVGGTTTAPPSKSYTHRAILSAGYADGTTVRDPLWSADTRATARAVEHFGGTVDRTDGGLAIDGFDGRPGVPDAVVDCANSGTTMRLVTAAAGLVDGTTVLSGDASLRARPQGPLLDALSDLGAEARSTRGTGQAPLVISGPIEGGAVSIPGDVSSQFITALLMAGAVTQDGIEIALETPLKSAPYVDITVEVLEAFGVTARRTADGFAVAGGQRYRRADAYPVPGDFSSISYLLAAGAIAAEEEVQIRGARPSAQGDAAIVSILERMGATIEWDRDAGVLTVAKSALTGIEVSVADTPDLLPTLAVLGAAADGEMHIVDAEHVRFKETDRVAAMAEILADLGVAVTEQQDSLTVTGSALEGGTVDGRGDHRIIMAAALAGLIASAPVTVRGADDVDVSYPGFFEVLADLGAAVMTVEE